MFKPSSVNFIDKERAEASQRTVALRSLITAACHGVGEEKEKLLSFDMWGKDEAESTDSQTGTCEEKLTAAAAAADQTLKSP